MSRWRISASWMPGGAIANVSSANATSCALFRLQGTSSTFCYSCSLPHTVLRMPLAVRLEGTSNP